MFQHAKNKDYSIDFISLFIYSNSIHFINELSQLISLFNKFTKLLAPLYLSNSLNLLSSLIPFLLLYSQGIK